MTKNARLNIRTTYLGKDIIEKLAKIKNLSVTEYILSCVIPLKLPKNLDEKVRKAFELQRQEQVFIELKREAKALLQRSFTIPNIKRVLMSMMLKDVSPTRIQKYLKTNALKFKKAIGSIPKDELNEWAMLKLMANSPTRIKAIMKIVKELKRSKIHDKILIDISLDIHELMKLRTFLKENNKLNNDKKDIFLI